MTTSQHDEAVRALSDEYPEVPTVQIEGYLDDATRTIIRATGNSDLIAAENLTRLRNRRAPPRRTSVTRKLIPTHPHNTNAPS